MLLVAPSQIYYQRTIHVLYAEVKPFIFKNERGEVTGIIPKQADNILKRCLPKNLLEKNIRIEDIFLKANHSEHTASIVRTPLFLKGGGVVNFNYLSQRGNLKNQKRGWKYSAGAGLLKR